jgi:hypothetical protein
MRATGLGEYSREILAEAGLDAPAIEELLATGTIVIGSPMHSVVGVGYR